MLGSDSLPDPNIYYRTIQICRDTRPRVSADTAYGGVPTVFLDKLFYFTTNVIKLRRTIDKAMSF